MFVGTFRCLIFEMVSPSFHGSLMMLPSFLKPFCSPQLVGLFAHLIFKNDMRMLVLLFPSTPALSHRVPPFMTCMYKQECVILQLF